MRPGRAGGRFLAALLLLSGLAAAGGARGAVSEIPAVRDNTMFDLLADTLSSSGAGPHLFAGRNSQGNTRRALLAFAVADSLPPGSVIQAVELRMAVSQVQNATPRTLSLHRVPVAWGEGGSISSGGAGATPQPGDATWVHRFFPDQEWTNPGGDFESTPSATLPVAGNGAYAWTGPGLTADVQAWVDQPASDFGWILLGDEGSAATVKRLNARENGDAGSRPLLVVTYTPPDVSVAPVRWGRLKAFSGNPVPAH